MSPKTALALAVTAALLMSCSGSVSSPEQAVDRMVKAYGGEDNLLKLMDFEGRGFRKKIPGTQVVTHYPFDIFQSGRRYKTRTYRVSEGQAVDVQVVIVGDRETFAWSYSKGEAAVPEWEVDIIKYKFPAVLAYLTGGGATLEHRESEIWDGLYHITFTDGDDRVDIGLDEKTWLVKETTVTSVSDAGFSFREEYSDYVKTDGIWFPGRFTGTFRDEEYYEFMVPVVVLGAGIADDVFTLQPGDTSLAEQ